MSVRAICHETDKQLQYVSIVDGGNNSDTSTIHPHSVTEEEFP